MESIDQITNFGHFDLNKSLNRLSFDQLDEALESFSIESFSKQNIEKDLENRFKKALRLEEEKEIPFSPQNSSKSIVSEL